MGTERGEGGPSLIPSSFFRRGCGESFWPPSSLPPPPTFLKLPLTDSPILAFLLPRPKLRRIPKILFFSHPRGNYPRLLKQHCATDGGKNNVCLFIRDNYPYTGNRVSPTHCLIFLTMACSHVTRICSPAMACYLAVSLVFPLLAKRSWSGAG